MATKKKTADEEYATDAEVEAAIGALSDADNVRLAKVASFRARALAGLGLGISGDDLLQEAIIRTLTSDRRWRKSVTFVKHLIATVGSIANHAPDELKEGVVVPATSEDSKGLLDGAPAFSRMADAERVAAANEQLKKIEKLFEDDDEVSLVLADLAKGMTGPEIQADLNLTPTDFETIMTRLRRGVDRKAGWQP